MIANNGGKVDIYLIITVVWKDYRLAWHGVREDEIPRILTSLEINGLLNFVIAKSFHRGSRRPAARFLFIRTRMNMKEVEEDSTYLMPLSVNDERFGRNVPGDYI